MDGAKYRTILLEVVKDLRSGWKFTFQGDSNPKDTLRGDLYIKGLQLKSSRDTDNAFKCCRRVAMRTEVADPLF